MSKKAFIFPGQASQYVGMAKDLYEGNEKIHELFEKANEIMGFDLADICFNGPEEDLKQTNITQPAIFVHSVAIYQLLADKGISPDAVAGHSLGEFSALVAAGAFSFEDGLNLVKIRGELMHTAGQHKPGTMAAIIGLEKQQVEEVCNRASDSGTVCPANFNSPGQVAISGDIPAVHRAMEIAKELGAKRALELVVSGAFHSPLMEFAQTGLAEALEKADIKNSQVPVYSNVMAEANQDAAKTRELLLKQLTSPVRWSEIIENMIKDGVTLFVETGPGKVLSGLNRRINRDIECIAVGDLETVENQQILSG
jgi:[acyl-carrier-protein] S-malonyltransferase